MREGHEAADAREAIPTPGPDETVRGIAMRVAIESASGA